MQTEVKQDEAKTVKVPNLHNSKRVDAGRGITLTLRVTGLADRKRLMQRAGFGEGKGDQVELDMMIARFGITEATSSSGSVLNRDGNPVKKSREPGFGELYGDDLVNLLDAEVFQQVVEFVWTGADVSEVQGKA